MANNQDFITLQSLSTFGGASVAVWVLSNTLRVLLNQNSRWFPFSVSMIISFISTNLAGTAENIISLQYSITAILNGCLLFLNALGLQTTMIAEPPQIEEQGDKKVKWSTSWWKKMP